MHSSKCLGEWWSHERCFIHIELASGGFLFRFMDNNIQEGWCFLFGGGKLFISVGGQNLFMLYIRFFQEKKCWKLVSDNKFFNPGFLCQTIIVLKTCSSSNLVALCLTIIQEGSNLKLVFYLFELMLWF